MTYKAVYKCSTAYLIAGTKNVDKQLRKITTGRVRDRDVTWFPQLVDKSEYFNCCCYCVELLHIREEYQGAPVLGNEELWRLSGSASSPHRECTTALHGIDNHTKCHVMYSCYYVFRATTLHVTPHPPATHQATPPVRSN